jgi:hypothetical protein
MNREFQPHNPNRVELGQSIDNAIKVYINEIITCIEPGSVPAVLGAAKEKFLNSSDARFNIKKKEELERVMDKIEQAIIKNNGVNFTDYDNLEAELRNAYINAMTMEGHQNIQ